MRTLLALALLGSVFVLTAAAPPSKFNKPLDEHKLEKEWQDPESDDWHEDTYEWKRKEAQKRKPSLDLNQLMAGGGGLASGKAKDMMLQQEASSGNMQMAFATLKKGAAKDQKAIEEIAGRWQGLLMTNGVKISSHAIGGDDILVTEDNGRILEVRDFLLNQPEIEKFRWKDTDFTPTPTPPPSAASKSKNKGPRKSKADKEKERREKKKAKEAAEKEAKQAAKRAERAARKAAAKGEPSARPAAAASQEPSPSAEPLALPVPAAEEKTEL